MKKRVKCANCGMVYDIIVGDFTLEQQLMGSCPKCKSNAFDVLQEVQK